MITKIHGKYYGVCDICGEEKTEPCDSWEEAKEQLKSDGFIKKCIMGEYHDVCRECRNKI